MARRTKPRIPHLTVVLALVGAGLVAAPGEADACHTATLCLDWAADFDDADFGEDFALADEIPAAGARVWIIRTPPEPPLSMFLDEDGCASFETQFAFGHKAVVYADAVIGNPAVRVRPYRSEDDRTAQQEYLWVVDVQGLAPDDVVRQTIVKDGDDPIVPMMAAATAVLQRFDELGAIPAVASLDLVYLDDTANARCSCDGSGPEWIEVGPDSYKEKFVMAHEMGHWLQAQWSGSGVGLFDYTHVVLDSPCQFEVVQPPDQDMMSDSASHGIRSSEWSSGALVEGYAQFLASVAFNDIGSEDGVFRYYKDIDVAAVPAYEDFVSHMSLVSLQGGAGPATLGGENQWVANMCPNDWATPLQAATLDREVSSEIDWMRFWWRFLTRQDSPQPELAEVLEFMAFVQAEYPWGYFEVWPSLREALLDEASGMAVYVTRFDAIADEMGVYNEES